MPGRRKQSRAKSSSASIRNRIGSVSKNIQIFFASLRNRGKKIIKRGIIFVEHKPLTSLIVIIALLFILILIGSFLRKPTPEEAVSKVVKDVRVYSIGNAPKLHTQAVVEKTGVVKIVALAPGIVQNVNVSEGQNVSQATTLVSLSTNYSGGNAPSVQRELAAATLANVNDTYQAQKEIIQKQKELADKNRENAEELRKITAESLTATRNLLSFNQGIVDTLNTNLSNLENNNTNGANDAAILQTKQLISQFQSGINQLQTQVKNTEYQTDANNPPTQLINITQDITKKQLNVQERALQLSLESAQIQLKLARIQEATMFPSAPFSGVIERIYVVPGQYVNPGAPLVLLHGAQTLKVVAKVPANIARQASYIEPANIYVNGRVFKETPAYISTEATDGNLYAIIYSLPEEFQNKLTDRTFIEIDIPIGYPDTTSAVPFVPIDAVFQSDQQVYLFVSVNKKARVRAIKLGDVVGEYVQVESGLTSGDHVILDRNVIDGENVKEVRY